MATFDSITTFLANTNFKELSSQKLALLSAQSALTAIGGEEQLEVVEKLEGLLNFIEAFQDMAVDVYGIDEKKVFNLSEE